MHGDGAAGAGRSCAGHMLSPPTSFAHVRCIQLRSQRLKVELNAARSNVAHQSRKMHPRLAFAKRMPLLVWCLVLRSLFTTWSLSGCWVVKPRTCVIRLWWGVCGAVAAAHSADVLRSSFLQWGLSKVLHTRRLWRHRLMLRKYPLVPRLSHCWSRACYLGTCRLRRPALARIPLWLGWYSPGTGSRLPVYGSHA